MKGVCGANCEECVLYKTHKCEGCTEDKKCWIAKYIKVGDKNNYDSFKEELIKEFNSLNIEGMPEVKELYPLNGLFVNLEYLLPSGSKTKFLKDEEVYLGNQIESPFNEGPFKKYFGLLANTSFLLVCEYKEYGSSPELLIYKKR